MEIARRPLGKLYKSLMRAGVALQPNDCCHHFPNIDYSSRKEVSHTRNFLFFPHAPLNSSFESKPTSPSPQPESPPGTGRPYLPTEICQNIFSHAHQSARRALEPSCRLFRGISQDFGPRIGEWTLQQGSKHDLNAFMGAADASIHGFAGRATRVPAQRSVVYITKRKSLFRQNHRVVLHTSVGKLDLRLPLLTICRGCKCNCLGVACVGVAFMLLGGGGRVPRARLRKTRIRGNGDISALPLSSYRVLWLVTSINTALVLLVIH